VAGGHGGHTLGLRTFWRSFTQSTTSYQDPPCQDAPGRERERPAQASADPSSRDSTAALGADDPGGHRHECGESAPRHQHDNWRRSVDLHPGRAAAFPRDQEANELLNRGLQDRRQKPSVLRLKYPRTRPRLENSPRHLARFPVTEFFMENHLSCSCDNALGSSSA
jgi:hypothetical protein